MSIIIGHNTPSGIYVGNQAVDKIYFGNIEVYSSTPAVSFPLVPYRSTWNDAQIVSNGLLITKNSSGTVTGYVYTTTQEVYVALVPSGSGFRIYYIHNGTFTGNTGKYGEAYNGSLYAANSAGGAQNVTGTTVYISYYDLTGDRIAEDEIPVYSSYYDLVNDIKIFFNQT